MLPERKFLSILSEVRLTRLLISIGMEPEIWFDPNDKSSSLLERLTTAIGKLPFRAFPSKDNFVSWVQFARDVRNNQS
jgi:hypothetical protein